MKNYVYTLSILLLLLLTSALATATHFRGGYIHYTLDPENHRKVHFTMTLYTASESPADEPRITISLGDGITVNVERHSATQIRPNVTALLPATRLTVWWVNSFLNLPKSKSAALPIPSPCAAPPCNCVAATRQS